MPTVSPDSLVAVKDAEVAVRNVAPAEVAKAHTKTDDPNTPKSQRQLLILLPSFPVGSAHPRRDTSKMSSPKGGSGQVSKAHAPHCYESSTVARQQDLNLLPPGYAL